MSPRAHVLWPLFLTAIARAADPASTDARVAPGIIELPKFVVTDSRELPPPEAWSYAEIPGLEVLSTIPATNARRFVRDFHRLQQVIEIVWPAVSQGVARTPLSLVLCGRGNQFDTFVPRSPASATNRPTSVFLPDVDRATIVLDYTTDRFDDRPIVGTLPSPLTTTESD